MRKIIDAHQHLWDIENNYYPWLMDKVKEMWIGDYSTIRKNYLPEDYKRDTSELNVVKTVHLQAMWNPEDPSGESAWLSQCHERHGMPTAIIGFANPASADFATLLEKHASYSNVRGIRVDLNWHENPYYRFCDRSDYMSNPEWVAKLALLESYGFSFDLQIYASHQTDDALKMMQQLPGIQFILNHIGLPYDRTESGIALWKQNLSRLATIPNLAVKVSGLGMFDHQWSAESIKPFVMTAIDTFGIDRCMFAANWPVASLYSTYAELVQGYEQILSGQSAADQDKFFHDNAARYYRI